MTRIRMDVTVPEGMSDKDLEHAIRMRTQEAMLLRAHAEGRPPFPPRDDSQTVERIEFIVTIGAAVPRVAG